MTCKSPFKAGALAFAMLAISGASAQDGVRGLTMIVVTHEIGFAREAADRVVFIDGGIVVEQGDPGQVLADPRHPRTRAFLSRFMGAL